MRVPGLSRWLGALTVAGVVLLAGCDDSTIDDTPVEVMKVAFTEPLAIPPLAKSSIDDDGTRVFELTAQEATTTFIDDVQTRTWGINGDYLGPTLRAQRGEQVAVEVTNALGEATTVHCTGCTCRPRWTAGRTR